jgi:hypothetical protein
MAEKWFFSGNGMDNFLTCMDAYNIVFRATNEYIEFVTSQPYVITRYDMLLNANVELLKGMYTFQINCHDKLKVLPHTLTYWMNVKNLLHMSQHKLRELEELRKKPTKEQKELFTLFDEAEDMLTNVVFERFMYLGQKAINVDRLRYLCKEIERVVGVMLKAKIPFTMEHKYDVLYSNCKKIVETQ